MNDHPIITGHYEPAITSVALSNEFLTDLLRTTAAVSEEFTSSRAMLAIFNTMEQQNHLPDGHLTLLNICAQLGLELTLAAYSIPDRDYNGVFEYELPQTFLNHYYSHAFSTHPAGNLPSPAWIRSTAKRLVTQWFHPDPDWEISVEGSTTPLYTNAKDLPNLINLLVSAGVDITKVSGIRQVPDGTD